MLYPHGDIESLGADIFAVRGSIRINLLMRISRNMGIVRDGSELTLVNPIQLRPETERKLAELGEVKNIVRLGAFHGIDDPCLLYTSPSPRDRQKSRMPSSA